MTRSIHRILAVLIAALALGGPGVARSQTAAEDAAVRIKAAFVYNFLKYTEWPAPAEESREASFVFDVVGRNGMAAALESVLGGKHVAGRPIRLRFFENPATLAADPSPGHALFVEVTAQSEWDALRTALAGRPTLTIAEMNGFCAAGGMLNLYEQDNRMRFEANPAIARARGLRLSAELLKLARIVDAANGKP